MTGCSPQHTEITRGGKIPRLVIMVGDKLIGSQVLVTLNLSLIVIVVLTL